MISVVAPAGYGKTTLLAQWAEGWQPRVAWVSADHRDNDPAVLLTYLATALDRVEPLAPAVLRTLATSSSATTVVRLLASAIVSMSQPVALVLDDAEVITNPECTDAITELALSFAAESRFAIASRDTTSLPAARLRAYGRIVEIGADDLAMSDREAAALLSGAGVDADAHDVNDLVQHTEGWPVGLYLAALTIQAGGSSTEIGSRLGHRRRPVRRRYPVGVPRPCVPRRGCSSPARRSSIACAAGCVTRSSVGRLQPDLERLESRNLWSSRSTAVVGGSATTSCSVTCCTRS